MDDKRISCYLKGENIKIGQYIKVKSGFFNSQCETKGGTYRLEKVSLSKVDVVIKNISNRDFFYFEDGKHLNNLKLNFQKTPPVIFEEFNDQYYSIDGHHRITVALELGLTNILAFVIKVDKLSYDRGQSFKIRLLS